VSAELLIDRRYGQAIVALVEDGRLAEVYLERQAAKPLEGNIYKGRVQNVLAGMQAAFVDLGLGKNAFLHEEDLWPAKPDGPPPKINQVLRPGREIMVQVTKEMLGSKGPRVTTQVTIAGRYLVLLPFSDYLGVSRKIKDDHEKERLRAVAHSLKPEGAGLIVRTVAQGVEGEELYADVQFLTKLWKKVQDRFNSSPAPAVIYQEPDLVRRVLRDILSAEVTAVLVDSPATYQEVADWVETYSPGALGKIKHDPKTMDRYDLDRELQKALNRKVWLDCGGYLVIDRTEALTVIDVNTGKFTGSTNLEDTVVKTNLEAAVEIARQLRLRNIGGIIIVDFIDMTLPQNREQVLRVLETELARDRVEITVQGITRLGLVEITRKKERQDLPGLLERECPYCNAKGRILSEASVAHSARRELNVLAQTTAAPAIVLEAHPRVAALLIGNNGSTLHELEDETGKTIVVKGVETQHLEKYYMRPVTGKQKLDGLKAPVSPGQRLEVEILSPHITNVNDGIARVEGFVVDVDGAGNLVGKTVPVRVVQVFRTYAKAVLDSNLEDL